MAGIACYGRARCICGRGEGVAGCDHTGPGGTEGLAHVLDALGAVMAVSSVFGSHKGNHRLHRCKCRLIERIAAVHLLHQRAEKPYCQIFP